MPKTNTRERTPQGCNPCSGRNTAGRWYSKGWLQAWDRQIKLDTTVKVAAWIAVAAVVTCLAFPPLFFGWVAAVAIWAVVSPQNNHEQRKRKAKPAISQAMTSHSEPKIDHESSSGVSPYEAIQPWLTKAVNHKNAQEWDEALSCLDKGYSLVAKYSLSEFAEYSFYLRLPAYLQLAGKNDLAWKYLNEYQCGKLPYRPQSDELALSIGYRSIVQDKMRLFLEREKKYRAALISRSVCQFLEASRVFLHHLKCIDYVRNERWLEKQFFQELDKKGWKAELERASENAERYGIPGIKADLWKTAKKAKLTEDQTKVLAAEVFAMACGVSSELEAVGAVADVMRSFAQVIDEAIS